MATILEEQQRRFGGQRPLYERMQEWITRMDIRVGAQFFWWALFGLLLAGVVLFYTGTQFFGLRDAQAMEMGQLARNLRLGRGYVTRDLRPSDLYYLASIGKPTIGGARTTLPELWTPPVYPWLLSVAMRAVEPEVIEGGKSGVRGDRLLMIVGWAVFLVGLLVMYRLALALFDRRVAVLSAFLYLFCNPLLSAAVSGLPTCWLGLVLMWVVYGVWKAEQWQMAGKSGWWINAGLGFSAVALGVGTLTEYGFAALTVPWFGYVAVTFPKQRWQRVGVCVGVVLVVLAPWVARNWRVARKPFGLAYQQVMEGVGRGTPYEIRVGQLQRTHGPLPEVRLRSLARKTVVNLRRVYESTVKETGASYLVVFFLVALLHGFRREEVCRLQWLLFWGLAVCVGWICVAGVPKRNPLTMFTPLMILYAVAFFYVLFERLQLRTRLERAGVVGLFMAVNCLPFALAILPPRETRPYPPYNAEVAGQFGQMFREDEVLATDIPWAVAWYADRSAVWAPLNESDFMDIHVNVHVFAGVYVTQATLQDQSVLEMFAGYQQFWLNMFQPPPPTFPLHRFQAVTPDGQQVLISNRP